MQYRKQVFAAALGVTVLVSNATAQDVFVYPNKGQSTEQTDQDKYACYQWARQQSGYDPMAAAGAGAAPPPAAAQGGAVRGAARGAVGGAAIGAIAGDTGKGAAIGAATGGLFGGMRQREANAQQHQQAQQQSAAAAGRADTYNRAYAACLEGRGYTVR